MSNTTKSHAIPKKNVLFPRCSGLSWYAWASTFETGTQSRELETNPMITA